MANTGGAFGNSFFGTVANAGTLGGGYYGQILGLGGGNGDDPKTVTGEADPTKPVPTYGGQPVKTDAYGDPSYLTENLGKDNPLPWQKYYDPGVVDTNDPNSLLSGEISRNAGDYANSANNGISTNTNFHTTPQTGNAGNPMADAISRKYQRDVNSKVQSLKDTNEQGAISRNSKNQAQAESVMAAAQNKENQNFLEQYDFQMKRYNLMQQHNAQVNASHSALIGNLLGITGSAMSLGMKG